MHAEVDPILRNADRINLNQYIPEAVVERAEWARVHIGIQRFGGEAGCTIAWHEKTEKAGIEGESQENRWSRRCTFYASIQSGAFGGGCQAS